ncbi:ATP synthase gamma chain [hydrothermal vent metagenome]|uniref:ATP synthase gamma chain n=1 Tax=hydrothermal vent metagenome TaxID=652676 RepID=A0A1W1C6M8_9ZZZZ
MANLKDIQRKIKSVKNTQKTTHAMKLVSSAKLKRTEELAKRSRVYAEKLSDMIDEIAQKIQDLGAEANDNIYFRENPNPKKVDIIFITADKGLCGGFNSQTLKRVNQLMEGFKSDDIKVRLSGVGRKGIDYYKFNNVEMMREVVGLSSAPDSEKAAEFISDIVNSYANGETDRIIMVHNGYVNMISQEIREDQVLPIDVTEMTNKVESKSELELEPDDDGSLLVSLMRQYIEYSMYYALIDSLAAEHAARMQAMDAATTNAKEMVKALSVKYNKARQEAITTELIEIISGMESMK